MLFFPRRSLFTFQFSSAERSIQLFLLLLRQIFSFCSFLLCFLNVLYSFLIHVSSCLFPLLSSLPDLRINTIILLREYIKSGHPGLISCDCNLGCAKMENSTKFPKTQILSLVKTIHIVGQHQDHTARTLLPHLIMTQSWVLLQQLASTIGNSLDKEWSLCRYKVQATFDLIQDKSEE